ncbi:hypothetical protein PsorP6_006806 [Peronosclerospora sorghi]|uniref:Uncharacterized protein n=1 Tax=Peronosclerospora sorghi TaxID=230839 RepID=A0ACC0W7I0_9STRA|nr:hypothetical protein PsorP6_006806 [Peronosclerospora sorghi]
MTILFMHPKTIMLKRKNDRCGLIRAEVVTIVTQANDTFRLVFRLLHLLRPNFHRYLNQKRFASWRRPVLLFLRPLKKAIINVSL